MAFTLTLLGKNVAYLPTVSDAYPRGETLSLISSLIKGDKEADLLSSSKRLNESVTVIEGSTNKVGERVTQAVIAVFEALSRGETQINILASDRAAVDAILITHELDRLQDLFANETFHEDDMHNFLTVAIALKRGVPHVSCQEPEEASAIFKIVIKNSYSNGYKEIARRSLTSCDPH